ncbi:MAG: choice-of-anchor B domain-containing protein [Lentisphaeria bacterium]|jgi:choice-of-anchor B domain-containing protein
MSRFFEIVAAAGLSALLGFAPSALADDSQPRYVAGKGTDSGDCKNLYRPCRSIPYAIAVAAKGDGILVATGDYVLASADEVYEVSSASHRISAGFDKLSGYANRDSGAYLATLSGVPPSLRDAFEAVGFRVIADQKGLPASEQKKSNEMVSKIHAAQKSHFSTSCSAGVAEGFPCNNINLQRHFALSELKSQAQAASDTWGFTDLNTQREYALIGLTNGVAVVDVSDAANAYVVSTVTGAGSSWRDIKILQQFDQATQRWHAYAYVTNEASGGLAIIDLSDLPNDVSVIPYSSDFGAAHNVYLANTDYTFGVALSGVAPVLSVAGSSVNGGRNRMYALTNPASPTVISTNTGSYMHDTATHRVRDSRKDTQCENSANANVCQVLADFNEGSVEVWDITDPASPSLLSNIQYNEAGYVHSGWFSEDGLFLFVHDELDERDNGVNTTVRVYDMSNLRSPQPAGVWSGPSRAIDHNGFVRGNRYYMSNYTEGLTVLDISDPAGPSRVGHFDTVPSTSAASFSGAWGVFPFYGSNTIVVSDINTGLYVLENDALASANGQVSFSASTYSGTEGQVLNIEALRTNGDSGAVSVALEIIALTSTTEDLVLAAEEFSWSDGEVGAKTLSLTLNTDGETEGIERFALRLVRPVGGATLQTPTIAQGYVSEPNTEAGISFVDTSLIAQEGLGKALVTLSRKGNLEQEISVDYATSEAFSGEVFSPVSGTLRWNSGDASTKIIEIPLIKDAEFDSDTNMVLELQNSINANIVGSGVAIITVQDENADIGDEPSPPADPPVIVDPPSSMSSGGGSMSLVFLLLMGGMLLRRGNKAYL